MKSVMIVLLLILSASAQVVVYFYEPLDGEISAYHFDSDIVVSVEIDGGVVFVNEEATPVEPIAVVVSRYGNNVVTGNLTADELAESGVFVVKEIDSSIIYPRRLSAVLALIILISIITIACIKMKNNAEREPLP